MRSAGTIVGLLLAAGASNIQLRLPSQSRPPKYYRAKPDTLDPLTAERVAWNKAVDERKAAKRAAKLATKGGV